jgi:hypothetical protein
MRAIATHQLGLLNGPLLHRGQWYQVEADGVLNPQPTPAAFAQMEGCGHTFCVRKISEERADQLQWPDEWSRPPEEEAQLDPSVPPDPQPGTIEDPKAYAEAVEEGRIAPVDYSALSWPELRAAAKERGLKAKSKDQVLADLAKL